MIAMRMTPPSTPPTMAAADVALLVLCRCSVAGADDGLVEFAGCDVAVKSDVVVLRSDALLVVDVERVGATVTTLMVCVVVVDGP